MIIHAHTLSVMIVLYCCVTWMPSLSGMLLRLVLMTNNISFVFCKSSTTRFMIVHTLTVAIVPVIRVHNSRSVAMAIILIGSDEHV